MKENLDLNTKGVSKNIYDNDIFFEKYSLFPRSVQGLSGAGEWHELRKLLPPFKEKRVLDLGCGFGWHCVFAAENGAASVVGVDISEKMLAEAKRKTHHKNITYIKSAIEDYEYPKEAFDTVISSLAFHYTESFDDICKKVNTCLVSGGDFVFSVEHPIFTAEGKQDWVYDENNNPLYWPVTNYFYEGKRDSIFLGEKVVKEHKTMTTYIQGLLTNGFSITGLCEPKPHEKVLIEQPDTRQELLRPMMLIISATKK